MPPPTGMSALGMPAPPPEPPDVVVDAEPPTAGGTVAAEVLVPESPPQAASAVAPRAATPTARLRITVRRSGVLRSRPGPHQAWFVLRGPGMGQPGSPLLKGGTYSGYLWFTLEGPAAHRVAGAEARSPRPVLCECGPPRVGRREGEEPGWTRRRTTRSRRHCGSRWPRPDVLGLVAPGVHGRPGLPAGRVLRPRLLRGGRARLRRDRCARTCPGCPAPTPCCCPSRDGARPEGDRRQRPPAGAGRLHPAGARPGTGQPLPRPAGPG